MELPPTEESTPGFQDPEQGLEGMSALELAETLEDGFLAVDAAGFIRAVNPAAERLLQCPRARLLGRALGSLSGEAARAWSEGTPAKLVISPGTSGQKLELRLHPRRGLGWLFLRDVSREHGRQGTTEDEVSRQRLRMVMSHAPVLLFALDRQGIVTHAAGKGHERLGLQSGALIGRSVFDEYRDVEWIVESIRRSLRGEEVSVVGAVQGTWFDVHYTPIRDATGQVNSVIGVATDVTERERALRVLRHQQSVLKYVIANVPHAVFWKDRLGRFLGGNQNFINDSGAGSLENLIGKTDFEVWSKREEAEFFVKIDREVMEQDRPFHDIEETVLRSDGSQRTLLTSKVPIRDEAGQVTGLLGIYVDITGRKQMELELEKAKQAAENAARAKSEFLTVMSHELRTPLTLILGPLSTLLSSRASELSERARSDLERIHGNARRLFQLVDDILDHQKLEAGQLRLDRQPVDVASFVAGLVEDARPAGSSRGLDVSFEPEPDLGVVLLDERKFEKIVVNLLGNALKFTPAGGRVVVSLRRAEEGFELSVRDTGPGIPVAKQEMIFQRFQQLDGSATRKHEGTGMGLAIVKEFAELMGGHVAVRSEPGEGACFSVTLPGAGVESSPEGPDALAGGSSGESSFRRFEVTPESLEVPRRPAHPAPHLLIADDNPGMRAYLAELLADEYDLVLVENGQQAWEAVQRERPDVIVSDLMMPEVDGIELTARLKADPRYRNVPVILLTAKASREDVVGGLDAGADDYLGKPFGPAELRARVRAAVRLHRVYLELQDTLRTLRDTQEQMVEGARRAAVGTLVAGLSHELNNPLAVIRLNSQMLSKHLMEPASLRKLLLSIDRQSQRCSHVLKALLELSHQASIKREWFQAGVLVDRVLGAIRSEAHRRGVHLESVPAPAGSPWVHVNAAEVESALSNVVTNALEVSPPGASVVVEVQPRERAGREGVEVLVRDSGPGIPAEVLPQVFDPFFTTKPPGEGMGLGLALARRFIDGQGGAVQVESEEGHGTGVRLWLPARASLHEEARPTTAGGPGW
ncbi:PAS domain-containing protein [Pyxidicoccus parkwayensis]|uniref:histidine kinase n=1 Tax=Pyxidicoccus parkwayensis TaxID=2813578 RepID=A0ABX7NZW2_9BACT|nr:ATP-binding protein [Pyxidicoccus parkwaysis]QSQ24461.1 PAS domain-containing protein [Pyxidicoccus parkwaysis]